MDACDSPYPWRHNGRDGVSNHQPHHCLFNRLFKRRSKKTSKLRVTGLCAGNSPATAEFPTQMTSNAENVRFESLQLIWLSGRRRFNVKKVISVSLRIKPLKCADKLKGTACDQGYLQVARDLYFEAFFYYWQIFVWHRMAQRDAMHHYVAPTSLCGACEGCKGLSMPQVGVWGSCPRNFFCKYKLWEGHFWAILNAPEKKAKKALRWNWEKSFGVPKKC